MKRKTPESIAFSHKEEAAIDVQQQAVIATGRGRKMSKTLK
jgi:hypothetical protein